MRRVSFPLLSSLVLLLCCGVTPAGSPDDPEGWYPLDGGARDAAATAHAITAVPGGMSFTIRIPGLEAGNVSTKGGPRGTLSIPRGAVSGALGEPRLPVVRYLVEIPPGARVRVDLRTESARHLSLAELGIDTLVPVQPSVPKIEGADALVPYRENAAVYATDEYLPDERVAVVDRAVLRGRHVALVEVRPVRYNPVTGSVEVWSRADLTLRFEGGAPSAATREKGRLASRPFDNWLAREIVSLPGQDPPPATMASGGEGAVGMLVIAHDDFVPAIQPFLDWKRRTGFGVELVKTSELGATPSDVSLKAAVQQRYDTWTNPPLSYVLLVGDTDFCPIHQGSGGGNSQVTDNWYACLDGSDYLPEVAIARISTRTAQETTDVVAKLLTYEQATFPTTDWIKKAGFIGTADTGHTSLIEDTHDWCIDNFYTPNGYLPTPWSHGYASCDRHYYTTNSTTAEIAASFSEGRGMVNYSGHGGNYSWEGPTSSGSYDQADINANTNAGMYPFVISNACVTGTLNNAECFGETWQKAPNKGAIGFWGASNNSYWDEDDVLQRALHTNLFPMGETPPLGVLVNQTKLDLYNHYGDVGNVAYYYDMYNLLSEPSLVMWTRAPRDWLVSYQAAHPIGESSFVVDVSYLGQPVVGALVAVVKDDDGVFEAGYTDATGRITLLLDPAPEGVGPMYVTATGQDFMPHQGSTEVISPDNPWLVHRSHGVDDAAGGDGDGAVNPGEEFVMPVTVENVGLQPGSGLQGILTTSTPQWCTILDGTASFPDLAPHEQGASLGDHFRVAVDPNAPDAVMLGFELDWTATGGAAGTSSFNQQVVAVNIVLDGHEIDDSLLGNGNGVAGPGETVDMTLTLANIGHREATGVSTEISTDSPYVTMLEDVASFPDIPAESVAGSDPPPLRFTVAGDAPDQQPVTFTLTVTETGSGYVEVVLFDVMISSCATTGSTDVPQPIGDNSTSESELYYTNAIEIGDVNVHVDIAHTYQGDLRVILEAPTGQQIVLHDRTGSGTDNINTWYDTETQPAEPLSVLVGENAFGMWRLIVSDHAGGDTGAINGWALEICGDAIEPVPRLELAGFDVEDGTACDPDGNPDVGETVTFNVMVGNTGWGAATGVRASLASAAQVAVLNNPVTLPDLAPGQEAMASFHVMIGAVGCAEQATFVATLQCNEGEDVGAFDEMLEVDLHETLLMEDVEQGGVEPDGWSHWADVGVDDWQVIGDRNHTGGGAWSWFSSDQPTTKDDSLVARPYDLAGNSTLEFWQYVLLEGGYDGGVLEISTDSGTSWNDLGPSILVGGYDRALAGTNPIAGREAWSGEFGEWRKVVVDLSPWSGQTVLLRWRLTCDASATRTGWWIDDVVVHTSEMQCDIQACGVPGEVQVTQVEKIGDDVMLQWWGDPLCVEFEVWRSSDPATATGFANVTAEDPDATDTSFLDTSQAGLVFWIVTGRGPDGDGPWGHYGQ